MEEHIFYFRHHVLISTSLLFTRTCMIPFCIFITIVHLLLILKKRLFFCTIQSNMHIIQMCLFTLISTFASLLSVTSSTYCPSLTVFKSNTSISSSHHAQQNNTQSNSEKQQQKNNNKTT